MMEYIEFKGNKYPSWQASGFAARFAFPWAQEVCKGTGYDIGCNREEWKFPGAIAIDPVLYPDYDATHLPDFAPEYIFSSHCLEHILYWCFTLDYWHKKLKTGGVLFLYLPDHSQVYWRPHHNRKHLHAFTPAILRSYFEDQPDMWGDVLVSNTDLNNSFIVIAHKK